MYKKKKWNEIKMQKKKQTCVEKKSPLSYFLQSLIIRELFLIHTLPFQQIEQFKFIFCLYKYDA